MYRNLGEIENTVDKYVRKRVENSIICDGRPRFFDKTADITYLIDALQLAG